MARKLPRTVLVLGFVSFFNDLASEMVTPFIPILVATVLGAGPVVLGLIEGVADAAASFLKLWAGRFSDAKRGRRKNMTMLGYGLSNMVRPLMGFAGSWGALLLLRSLDRVGKGVRSAPRDALMADAADRSMHGHAYGFQRALDNAGAMGGCLLAALAIGWGHWPVSQVIFWSVVPGVLVMFLLAWGVQEPLRQEPEEARLMVAPQWHNLSPGMQRYLLVLVLFTFARASESFILLRGTELDMSVVQVLLLWATLNITKAATSTYGGRLADALGLARLTMVGWVGYGISFIAISQISQVVFLWLATVFYGLVTGLSEGSERALISSQAAEDERGTAFGWYHLAVGLSAIPAGLLFGGVWHYRGAGAAFLLAGCLALICVGLLRGMGQSGAAQGK